MTEGKLIVEVELENLRECETICRDFIRRSEMADLNIPYTYTRCKAVIEKMDKLNSFVKGLKQ